MDSVRNKVFELYEEELSNYSEWLENIVKIEPVSLVTEIKIKRDDGYKIDLTKWKHHECKYLNFFLTDEQFEKYDKWRKTLPKKDFGAVGGGYSFCFNLEGKIVFKFTPTGLGYIVNVISKEGFKVDLTDWDSW